MGKIVFSFYWPYLALLLPLPLLAWWLLPADKKADTNPELLFPFLDKLKKAFPKFKYSGKRFRRVFLVLLLFVWILLVLAIMRPQLVDQYSHIQNEGYDLMLAVDISGSMRALDFSTENKSISRLDVTKDVVGEFVEARQGDRVGLILFGEYAYMQVPLTLDIISVSNVLNNATIGMAGDATAIGDAIGLAVKNLRERPEESRVIILLTDGEDTASSVPPIEVAELAKQYGIRIYTIGVGRDGPVPYPDDFFGTIMAELPMDEELLKNIAEQTGGKYFLASDANTLEDIYATINTLEKTKSETREYLIRQPLYRYPLGAASVLLLILCLAPIYKRVLHGV